MKTFDVNIDNFVLIVKTPMESNRLNFMYSFLNRQHRTMNMTWRLQTRVYLSVCCVCLSVFLSFGDLKSHLIDWILGFTFISARFIEPAVRLSTGESLKGTSVKEEKKMVY